MLQREEGKKANVTQPEIQCVSNKQSQHEKKCEKKIFFNCFYTNVRSQDNKGEELVILIEEKKFDITGITEIWWDGSHGWNVKITHYRLFRKDKLGKGGESGTPSYRSYYVF